MRILSLFLMAFMFFGIACGEKTIIQNVVNKENNNPLDEFPELELMTAVPDFYADNIRLKEVNINDYILTYGYEQGGRMLRARLQKSDPHEVYEFIFNQDGAAGLCMVLQGNKVFYSPMREERPVAFFEEMADESLVRKEVSLDSLAEVMLSYRMDLVVNEP